MQPGAFSFQYWTDWTADEEDEREEGGFTLLANIHRQTIITAIWLQQASLR